MRRAPLTIRSGYVNAIEGLMRFTEQGAEFPDIGEVLLYRGISDAVKHGQGLKKKFNRLSIRHAGSFCPRRGGVWFYLPSVQI